MGTNSAWLTVAAVTLVSVLLSVPGWWLFYRSARRVPADAYWQMEQTLGDMSRRMRDLETDRQRDHLLVLRLQGELELWKEYSRRVADLLREAGHEPPPAPTVAPMPDIRPEDERADQVTTQRRIAEAFNLEELNDLAFRVGFDPDELKGDTVTARSRSLVGFAKRRGRMAELIAMCRLLRPEGGF